MPLHGDRPHGAGSQARQFLRRDRAGRLLPGQHRAGHRFHATIRCCRGGCSPISTRSCRGSAAPNFHQIPINAPKCPFANFQRDGHMQMQRAEGAGRTTSRARSQADIAARDPRAASAASPAVPDDGDKGRIRAESFADHYSQARLFFRSQTEPEQAHIASALVFELSKVETPHVREAIVGHLRNVDADLAQARRRRPRHASTAAGATAAAVRPRTWSRRRRCRSSAR